MSDDDLVLPNRRQSDAQITALRAEIKKSIETHFEDDHYAISKKKVGELLDQAANREEEHQQMKVEMGESREMLSYMLIALQGVPDHDFMGKPNGKYVGGMENDIKELKEQGNGGGGFSVRTSSKLMTALLTTGMIAIAQVVVAFIGRI